MERVGKEGVITVEVIPFHKAIHRTCVAPKLCKPVEEGSSLLESVLLVSEHCVGGVPTREVVGPCIHSKNGCVSKSFDPSKCFYCFTLVQCQFKICQDQ